MPSTAKNLEHLPNELLVQCFSHLCKSSHTSSFIDNSPDIQRLRLVSKKCHANSSPLLIFSATVYITSASLFHLEELCSHPIFGQSINQVEINCSYYDVCMAESRGVYSYRCGSKLYQNLGNNPVDEMALYRMSDDWSALNKRGFLEKKPKLTENQQWLLDVHGQYKKLCEDQVRVKIDNAHIQRICTALMRLPQLHSLSLTDDSYYPVRRHRALSDADILERCLLTSTWKGSFPTAFFIRPPVEIIPDLFTALAQTDIRPTRIAIDVKPPNNLHCLKLPEPAQQAINTVSPSFGDASSLFADVVILRLLDFGVPESFV
ncbi:hypothetical protein E2P81_ATG02072 [Venturia nashicola]|nr:hypothetical protein E2P81_ATG02072 [Venturia nashicola]